MIDALQQSAAPVLDSETFERLPSDQKLSSARTHIIDSETFEPLLPPESAYGPVQRLRVLIQRALEAELDYYSHVFGARNKAP